jgi:transcriptional regulator with XRE-family HTH domain
MADDQGLDLVVLGQTIRSLRLGKEWSLAQLAEESSVSKAYLSDLENGNAGKPNIQYVYAVAAALGVTLDDLLGDAKPKVHRREKRSTKELPAGLLELQQEISSGSAENGKPEIESKVNATYEVKESHFIS